MDCDGKFILVIRILSQTTDKCFFLEKEKNNIPYEKVEKGMKLIMVTL